MDSYSVLRSTAVAVIASSVIGGASATPAMAEQSTASQGVHVSTWKMRVAVNTRKIRRAPVPTKTTSKAYAFRLVSRRAWPSTQFQCLDSLWTRESNWNHRAYNAGSGAYGIPQALPGSKMGYVAEDWRFNPQTQIRWGLRYIKGRYGSPCGAWGHFRSHNWY
ncbi:transglycosylase SLT domain-containing protein [Planotetraspora thailandica]|uniref:aggregation-promoting factor C-terminal-like domain-containing protein n=1 Tax=Planotetraspora thailandica TaxID=487172 RepID=UPI00195290F8|nr:transglycosylase SLT domain-containing protein [Planotetraspora thailandica]